MRITQERAAELRRKAEAATARWSEAHANASYLAAANPATVLDLLADRDELMAEVERLKRELKASYESRNREAQLAVDLRNSQDEIIERCAKAVDEWPEAAARLRRHCGGAQDEDHAVSGEDFGAMRREVELLRAKCEERKAVLDGTDQAIIGDRGDKDESFPIIGCRFCRTEDGHKPDCAWKRAMEDA